MTFDMYKLQRPLFSSDGLYGDILVYNEDRSHESVIPLDGETIKELFGDEVKIYVLGYLHKGNLVINKIVEEQDW